MVTTTNGEAVSLLAEKCMPFVQAAGYAAETNMDDGVWMFYSLYDGVQCFIDVSEYDDEDDCILGFNAIFQPEALPATAPSVISKLGLDETFAYDSNGALIVHAEHVTEIGNANSDWFASHFQVWNRELLDLVARAKNL